MNHKLWLEWQERLAGKKKHQKYDKKVLRQALDAVEAKEEVYCKAIVCETIVKPRAKYFLSAIAGDPLDVMQCVGMSTPPGLWIVRNADHKIGFIHTDDIMLNADDVRGHHMGNTPASTPVPEAGDDETFDIKVDPKAARRVSLHFPGEDTGAKAPKKSLADHLYESTDDEQE